jgi:hypothetical protein
LSVARVTPRTAVAQIFSMSVGDIALKVRPESEELRQSIARRYAAFSGEAKNSLAIQVTSEPAAGVTPIEFACDFGGARVKANRQGACFLAVKNEYEMDSLLRMYLSWELLSRTGFLLHAATIVRNGLAYVFAGRSGAGKSTVAALSPAGSVLTDEISLLRRENGTWRAYGTPFWGEFRAAGSNTSAPVAGIFKLAQTRTNERQAMGKTQLLRVLLTNILFFSNAQEDHQRLLEIATMAAEEMPGALLQFQKTAKFWEAILK